MTAVGFPEALLWRSQFASLFDFDFSQNAFCQVGVPIVFLHLVAWILSCWLGVVWGLQVFVISLFGFCSVWTVFCLKDLGFDDKSMLSKRGVRFCQNAFCKAVVPMFFAQLVA